MTRPASNFAAAEESPYSQKFFDVRTPGSIASARAILPLVFELLSPRSIVDVGCGAGAWLAVAMEMGIKDAVGIDGVYVTDGSLKIPPKCFRALDLESPAPLGRSFDLAICLEVAEHLPKSSAAVLISFLTQLAPAVLFSAAIPGQGGCHHVNEQWPDYWNAFFAHHEFCRVDCIRAQVWNREDVEPWYAQNCFLYVQEQSDLRQRDLLAKRAAFPAPVPAVHPAIYDAARDVDQLTPRPLLRLLARSFRRSLAMRLKRISQVFDSHSHSDLT
ncbi:MAG TPA: methyltransferase domain-containing protein [Candidatus Acidoferrales bacterium]|nr:methyltransferase domain-containing protein [Candidatus Acidoferrales bacterium]